MITVCKKCKGTGLSMKRLDIFTIIFSLGLTLMVNKKDTCYKCKGKGYV